MICESSRLRFNFNYFDKYDSINLEKFGKEEDYKYIEYLYSSYNKDKLPYIRKIFELSMQYSKESMNTYNELKRIDIFIENILKTTDPYWADIIKTAKENHIVKEIIE